MKTHLLTIVCIAFIVSSCKKESANNNSILPSFSYQAINQVVQNGQTLDIDIDGDGQKDLSIAVNPPQLLLNGIYETFVKSITTDNSKTEVKETYDFQFDPSFPKQYMVNSYAPGALIDSRDVTSNTTSDSLAVHPYFSQGFLVLFEEDFTKNPVWWFGKFISANNYLGFRIKDSLNRWHYGWLSITGSKDRYDSITINEICYDNNPNELIKAGEH